MLSVQGEQFVYCLAEAGGQLEGKFGGWNESAVLDGVYCLAGYSHDVGQFLLRYPHYGPFDPDVIFHDCTSICKLPGSSSE